MEQHPFGVIKATRPKKPTLTFVHPAICISRWLSPGIAKTSVSYRKLALPFQKLPESQKNTPIEHYLNRQRTILYATLTATLHHGGS
jgi:hypothetical protein